MTKSRLLTAGGGVNDGEWSERVGQWVVTAVADISQTLSVGLKHIRSPWATLRTLDKCNMDLQRLLQGWVSFLSFRRSRTRLPWEFQWPTWAAPCPLNTINVIWTGGTINKGEKREAFLNETSTSCNKQPCCSTNVNNTMLFWCWHTYSIFTAPTSCSGL